MRLDPKDLLSFRVMITPVVIQVLFWILSAFAILMGLIQLIGGLASRQMLIALSGLVMIAAGPLIIRIYCEVIMVFFRIYDEVRAIRACGPPEDASLPAPPPPQSA